MGDLGFFHEVFEGWVLRFRDQLENLPSLVQNLPYICENILVGGRFSKDNIDRLYVYITISLYPLASDFDKLYQKFPMIKRLDEYIKKEIKITYK